MNTIGNYEIISKIGEGGMGTVLLGKDLSTDQSVAIKVVRSEVTDNQSMLARFKREIEISKQMAHPFVIKILDGGYLKANDCFFMVMEFLEGMSMNDCFQTARATQAEAQSIMLHMAEAFSYIHKQGVFHRDVKPDNILVVSKERTVLLDFGLALADDRTRLSRTSDRPGTWITMSPEQLCGDPLDGRSDIYSLGVSMYWAVTGKTPYNNDQIIMLATGNEVPSPAPPHLVNDSIEPWLSNIILKALNPSISERFQTAEEMIQAIRTKSVTTGSPKETEQVTRPTSRKRKIPAGKPLSKSKRSGPNKPVSVPYSGHPKGTPTVFRKKIAAVCILIVSLVLLGMFLSSQSTAPQQTARKETINSLTARLLQEKKLPDTSDCEKLAQLMKESGKDIQAPRSPAEKGLYFLYLEANRLKSKTASYRFFTGFIYRYGYNAVPENILKLNFILMHLAVALDCYNELIEFHDTQLEKAEEEHNRPEEFSALFSLTFVYKFGPKVAKHLFPEGIQESRPIALSYSHRIMNDYLNGENLKYFSDLYLSVLHQEKSQKNRDEGMRFCKHWDTEKTPIDSRIELYIATASMLTNIRADGFNLIPREDKEMALSFKEKALNLSEVHNSPRKTYVTISTAETLWDLGKKDNAMKLLQALESKIPDIQFHHKYVNTYSSFLWDLRKPEEAIQLLCNALDHDTSNHVYTEGDRAILEKRLHKYEETKVLFSIGNR